MAAVANVLGALVSTKVARTVGGGIIDPPSGREGLIIVLSALLGAIAWNLGTWFFGLPSSSSHSLIGGLVGAALVGSNGVQWAGLVDKVIIPMVLSPMIGLALGYVFMLTLLWVFKRANATKTQRGFRQGQIVSAGTMAFGHGTQDAQKTMGVIALALTVSGHLAPDTPLWVILCAARAISLGTCSGGWRVMQTLGRRIISLSPVSGFASQTVASGVLWTTAYLGCRCDDPRHPGSVMGVGATRRLSAVRWGVAGIVTAWVLTIPAAAAVAALFWLVLRTLG
jgi:PiT family inorganic phosphate transporter